MRQVGAIITVSWGYDVQVSITLSPRNWTRVKSGKPLQIRGNGYHYEGEFFWDYWNFEGGVDGALTVAYGDGGEGFNGTLDDATIEEKPVPLSKRKS